MMKRLSLCLALLGASSPLFAQTPAATTAGPDCAAPLTAPAKRWTTDSIVVSVEPNFQLRNFDRKLAEAAAISIASSIVLPQPIELPPVVMVFSEPASGRMQALGVQAFHAEAMVKVDREGAVEQIALTQSSMSPALDGVLLQGVRDAMSIGLPPGAVDAAKKSRGGALFVGFGTGIALRVNRFDRTAPWPAAIALAAMKLPMTELSEEPRRIRMPKAEYPRDDLAARKGGRVVFEFVIGADSTVVPSSVRVAGADEQQLGEASWDALRKGRFAPAKIGACPVRTLIAQPFTFGM